MDSDQMKMRFSLLSNSIAHYLIDNGPAFKADLD